MKAAKRKRQVVNIKKEKQDEEREKGMEREKKDRKKNGRIGEERKER